MKRPVAFALFLYILGAGFYFALSRGPLQVQLVTAPVQFLLLVGSVMIVWSQALGRLGRALSLVCFVAFVAAMDSWLSSRVIAALIPFHMLYFLTTVAAFLAEVLFFVAVVWSLDRVFRKSHNPALLSLLLLVACSSGRGIVEPEVILRPAIEYPEHLRRDGVEGIIRGEAIIGIGGTPRQFKVLPGDDGMMPDSRLADLSIQTLGQWRFKPAMQNSQPLLCALGVTPRIYS